jgi:hypothetical protein
MGPPDSLIEASVEVYHWDGPDDGTLADPDDLFRLMSIVVPDWEWGPQWLTMHLDVPKTKREETYETRTHYGDLDVHLQISMPAGALELTFAAPAQYVNLGNGLRLVTEVSEETSERVDYSARMYAPTIQGSTAPAVLRFNQLVYELVSGHVEQFREWLDDGQLPEFGPWYAYIDYMVLHAEGGVISIRFIVDTYFGGAHPNNQSSVLNYDLVSGKAINLADLFEPGADYLGALSAYCRRDLEDRDLLEFEDGVLPRPENYRSWNISPEGLVINFDAYQVGPYAMGAQRVVVPYSALESILRADDPIAAVRE